MIKVYTRTGDDGSTGLYQQKRVSKDSPIIDAIGKVDELNCWIGSLVAQIETVKQSVEGPQPESKDTRYGDMKDDLLVIQRRLFDLGGAIASGGQSNLFQDFQEKLSAEWVEKRIDQLDQQLDPIKQFILPGGSQVAASAHLCRAVCRAAERELVGLFSADSKAWPLTEPIRRFVNRLSDYFFVLARTLNRWENREDIFWSADDD